MPRIEPVIIKGKMSLPLNLRCPETGCDGTLYISAHAVETGENVPGYCNKCDYEGFRHGGFSGCLEQTVAAFLEHIQGEERVNG